MWQNKHHSPKNKGATVTNISDMISRLSWGDMSKVDFDDFSIIEDYVKIGFKNGIYLYGRREINRNA